MSTRKLKRWIGCLAVAAASLVLGTDYYVAQNGQTPDTNIPPAYASWETAASNIQEAVTIAASGATVLVGPGTYTAPSDAPYQDGTNVVYFDKPLTLRAALPPGVESGTPVINGEGRHRGLRLYLPSGEIVLDGLTITNCYLAGSGELIKGAGILLTSSTQAGMGLTLRNCTLTHNHTEGGAGALYYRHNNTTLGLKIAFLNCVIRNNSAASYAGAIYRYVRGELLIRDSVIENNTAGTMGGGMYIHHGSLTIENSMLRGNTTGETRGGGAIMTQDSVRTTIRNTLFANNTAPDAGGSAIWGHQTSRDSLDELELFNCTIANNSGTGNAIGFRYDSTNAASYFRMDNSIVHGNTPAAISENMMPNYIFSHNCHDDRLLDGPGNITDDPLFVNPTAGNFRLKSTSPCVNTGTNQLDWMLGARDLDNGPRINPVGYRVDMGAYEHAPQGTVMLFR